MSDHDLESNGCRVSDNGADSRGAHLLQGLNQNDWQTNLFPSADTASCHLPQVSIDGGHSGSGGSGQWSQNPAGFMFGSKEGSPTAFDANGQASSNLPADVNTGGSALETGLLHRLDRDLTSLEGDLNQLQKLTGVATASSAPGDSGNATDVPPPTVANSGSAVSDNTAQPAGSPPGSVTDMPQPAGSPPGSVTDMPPPAIATTPPSIIDTQTASPPEQAATPPLTDTTTPPLVAGSPAPVGDTSTQPPAAIPPVATISAPPIDTPPTTVAAGAAAVGSGGNFSVTPAGFVAPDGSSWNMAGLNAGVTDALNGFPNVLTGYPNLTAIRLNVNPGQDSMSDINNVIQEYTKAGIVVEAEDHSGNGDNVDWYTQMAQTYKNNPLVMLETPNEPTGDAQTVANEQIQIIQAIRSAGFNNPIGIQPDGGFDQSNIPLVTAAVGTTNEYVTPHIYYSGTDPNGAMSYAQSEISGANQQGLFAAIDEFGNAEDGFTTDPQGQSVISSITQLNQQGFGPEQNVGAIFWGMDNGNHPDGADSAFLTPDGSQLTPIGQELQSWLG
jgi:Cellulase (glycosyl hydrolase family 5)